MSGDPGQSLGLTLLIYLLPLVAPSESSPALGTGLNVIVVPEENMLGRPPRAGMMGL